MTGGRFNPWRWFRDERAEARLHFAEVHPSGRGRVEVDSTGTENVYIDDRLDRRNRNAVAAHEANHLRRGVQPLDCPQALRDKEEEIVRRITTDGLIPPLELACYIRARLSIDDQVTVEEIVEHFDVPPETVCHAAWLVSIRPEGRGAA